MGATRRESQRLQHGPVLRDQILKHIRRGLACEVEHTEGLGRVVEEPLHELDGGGDLEVGAELAKRAWEGGHGFAGKARSGTADVEGIEGRPDIEKLEERIAAVGPVAKLERRDLGSSPEDFERRLVEGRHEALHAGLVRRANDIETGGTLAVERDAQLVEVGAEGNGASERPVRKAVGLVLVKNNLHPNDGVTKHTTPKS